MIYFNQCLIYNVLEQGGSFQTNKNAYFALNVQFYLFFEVLKKGTSQQCYRCTKHQDKIC